MPTLFTNFHSFFLLLLSFSLQVASESQCVTESTHGCHDKSKALKLNLIAIAVILVTSMIGVCLLLLTQSIPTLNFDSKEFSIIKAFTSGVILATGYMHVLLDSFPCLESNCLPDHPWKKFPFSTFVAMLPALLTLKLDSLAMSYHTKPNTQVDFGRSSILKVGLVLHSVVIGLSSSHNPCMIRPLITVMCLYQFFEGIAVYKLKMNMIMVFFFSYITPFGIALAALIVVGVLDATPAGILNYKALVNLLVVDFMGYKLQQNVKFQMLAFLAVLLGVVGMTYPDGDVGLWAMLRKADLLSGLELVSTTGRPIRRGFEDPAEGEFPFGRAPESPGLHGKG
ncbi:hypothetical protein ACB092_01G088600 [Castanea dentata]